jgi:hypothetical protein
LVKNFPHFSPSKKKKGYREKNPNPPQHHPKFSGTAVGTPFIIAAAAGGDQKMHCPLSLGCTGQRTVRDHFRNTHSKTTNPASLITKIKISQQLKRSRPPLP